MSPLPQRARQAGALRGKPRKPALRSWSIRRFFVPRPRSRRRRGPCPGIPQRRVSLRWLPPRIPFRRVSPGLPSTRPPRSRGPIRGPRPRLSRSGRSGTEVIRLPPPPLTTGPLRPPSGRPADSPWIRCPRSFIPGQPQPSLCQRLWGQSLWGQSLRWTRKLRQGKLRRLPCLRRLQAGRHFPPRPLARLRCLACLRPSRRRFPRRMLRPPRRMLRPPRRMLRPPPCRRCCPRARSMIRPSPCSACPRPSLRCLLLLLLRCR